MEVKDLFGLSDPMCKIIDALKEGVSALGAPWMYKRMERAKAQMRLETSKQNREISLRDALADRLKDEILTGRDKREMKNIADVVGLSAKLVNSIAEVSDEPVNPDWAARYFDYVKNCSDDDVKQIWARILAGEVETPGTFSYRTLDALRNITKNDADLLVKYADRVALGGLMSQDIPALDITRLAEAGFLNESPLEETISLETSSPVMVYSNKEYLILAASEGAVKRVQCDYRALTTVGKELYPLVPIGSNRETAMKICKQLERGFNAHVFSVHRVLKWNVDSYTYCDTPEE